MKARDTFGTRVRPERGETGARECRLKVVLEDGQHGGGEPLEHWVRVHPQLYEGWKTCFRNCGKIKIQPAHADSRKAR